MIWLELFEQEVQHFCVGQATWLIIQEIRKSHGKAQKVPYHLQWTVTLAGIPPAKSQTLYSFLCLTNRSTSSFDYTVRDNVSGILHCEELEKATK